MTVWGPLYEQHHGMRSVSTDLATALRQRLLALAKLGHCAPTIQGRFTRRDLGAVRELYIQPATPHDKREPMDGLPSLQDAHLTVLALISRRRITCISSRP
jgi:hypothetical protein